jgi:BTB/POZ domain
MATSSSSAEMMQSDSVPSADMSSISTYYYNKQLLRTGAFADCTLTCRGRSWPAHRNILSPRCEFFRCCLDGRFTEGQTRVIAMDCDDPIAVEGMLYYLYTLDYPTELYQAHVGVEMGSGSDSGIEDDDWTTSSCQNPLVYWGFDRLIYTIADKYGLVELRQLARRSLLDKAEAIEKEQQQQQQQQLAKSMDGFVALIETLYAGEEISEHERELRTEVVRSASEAITKHVRDQRISTLMSEVPEFTIELVEALSRKREERRLLQREEEKAQEAARIRRNHIPMNDESDDED